MLKPKQRTVHAEMHLLKLPQNNEIYQNHDVKLTQSRILGSLKGHMFPEGEKPKKLDLLHPPERLIDAGLDDAAQAQIQKKLQAYEFSGVTNNLDNILDRLNKTSHGKPPLVNGAKHESKETAFEEFAYDMKYRFSHLQVRTARAVLLRMQKDIKFVDIGVQCGQLEIDVAVQDQIAAQAEYCGQLEGDVEDTKKLIKEKEDEMELLQDKNTKMMVECRTQKSWIQVLELDVDSCKEALGATKIKLTEAEFKVSGCEQDIDYYKKQVVKLSVGEITPAQTSLTDVPLNVEKQGTTPGVSKRTGSDPGSDKEEDLADRKKRSKKGTRGPKSKGENGSEANPSQKR